MYSILISKLQKSFAYLFMTSLPEGKEPIIERRSAFQNIFSLLSALDYFNRDLEVAQKELDDLAKGGAVVKTVVQNKLNKVTQSARRLGDSLCRALPNSSGGFDTRESDRNELALHEGGLYRFYITSPNNRISKCGGLDHCYCELCPYLIMVDGKASYQVAYTLSEPILTTENIYKDANYNSVPMEKLDEHLRECISRNISQQLKFEKIDLRETGKLAECTILNFKNVAIGKKLQKELANVILKAFSLESLLQSSFD